MDPATGAALRRARESRGHTLVEAATALDVDVSALAALEGGTADDDLRPAAARANLRLYARWLGLDA